MDKVTFNAAFEKKMNTKTCKICEKYHLTRSKVKQSTVFFENTYKDNSHLRDQIILGSILGDGFIQRKTNCYSYRECHSLKEEEYLRWKFLMMDDWVDGSIIYNKNFNNSSSDAKELSTRAKFSHVFERYYSMPIQEVIERIDIYGLIIFILDDGWYSAHSKLGNIMVSAGSLSEDELKMVQRKFESFSIETNLIGRRKDISIPSKYNFVLLSYLSILFDGLLDIDVINKKFGHIKESYINLLS